MDQNSQNPGATNENSEAENQPTQPAETADQEATKVEVQTGSSSSEENPESTSSESSQTETPAEATEPISIPGLDSQVSEATAESEAAPEAESEADAETSSEAAADESPAETVTDDASESADEQSSETQSETSDTPEPTSDESSETPATDSSTETAPDAAAESASESADETAPETSTAESATETTASSETDSDDSAASEPDSSADSTPAAAETPTPVVATYKNLKLRKFLKVTALIVLLVILAAGLWWVVSGRKTTPKSTVTVKAVSVIHYGSLEGPIGKSSTFPSASTLAPQTTIDQQVYEGLVGLNNRKVVPLLATSWKNPDENTWIFTLRSDVTFQNGKKMDAAAVKASLDALQNNQDWSQYVSTIKSVDVVDATHVKITTTQPDALLLNRLTTAFIYDTTDTSAIPAGTGAYTIDTAKSNDTDTVVLKPYDKYYQGVPKTRSLVFTIYPTETAMLAAAKAQKIDVMDDNSNPKLDQQMSQNGFSNLSSELPGSFSLEFNMLNNSSSAVAKPQVRQAVAYAVDRAALVKKLTQAAQPTRYMIPQSVLGYDSTAQLPDTSLTKAKALQAAAGYPSGAPITVAYIKDIQEDMPIVISQLQAAGFKVTPKPAASPDEMVAIIKSGKFDMIGVTTSTDYSDGGDYFTQVLSSQDADFPLYNIPEVDALIAKSNQEFDTTARIKDVQAINRYAASNYLMVPVRNTAYAAYYKKNLTYAFDFNASAPATYFWNVGQKVVTTN